MAEASTASAASRLDATLHQGRKEKLVKNENLDIMGRRRHDENLGMLRLYKGARNTGKVVPFFLLTDKVHKVRHGILETLRRVLKF